MSNLAPAQVMIHPSHIEPRLLMPYNQASGFQYCFYGDDLQVQIGSEDLAVYVKRIDVRTIVAGGQSAYNQLPSISAAMSMISVPTYLMRVRAEYDHHDTAAYGGWGVNITQVQREGMRQAQNQFCRSIALFGMSPSNGEGLLNTNGATTVSLPPDANGNTTVLTYDPGQMAQFLLSTVSAMKTRTNQLGIGRRFTILGPQRVLGPMGYQNVVQLTSFQREGAGSASTTGMFKEQLTMNGDTLIWAYDDTLQGKGAGGTDAVIIAMPEVANPRGTSINTNVFANISPGLDATTIQYSDMAAPREIPSPMPGGAIDILSEWRLSPGWAIRPEAITIVSMAAS